MELPDDIYEQIEILSESGNEASDDGDFDVAIHHWQQALSLLPEPAGQWEAYMWLSASIGDAFYQAGDYQSARASLHDALDGPDGQASGFVHYMLGKTLLRLDDEKAVEHLLQAYMAEGLEIFESDDEEGADSLKVLQDRKLIDQA